MTLAEALRANAAGLALLLRAPVLRKRDLAGLIEDLERQAAEAEVLQVMASTGNENRFEHQRFRRTNDEGPSALPTPMSPLTVEPVREVQNSYAVHPTPRVGRPANWTRPTQAAPTISARGVTA